VKGWIIYYLYPSGKGKYSRQESHEEDDKSTVLTFDI